MCLYVHMYTYVCVNMSAAPLGGQTRVVFDPLVLEL